MTFPPSGRALLLTFIGLVVLAGGSWLAADYGTGTGVALAIAAVKAGMIGFVFMELGGAHAGDRIIIAVAALFIALLVGGTLTDVAFR